MLNKMFSINHISETLLNINQIVNLISISVRVLARTKHVQLGLMKCFNGGGIYSSTARFKRTKGNWGTFGLTAKGNHHLCYSRGLGEQTRPTEPGENHIWKRCCWTEAAVWITKTEVRGLYTLPSSSCTLISYSNPHWPNTTRKEPE